MTLVSPHGAALTNANQKPAADKFSWGRKELLDDRHRARDHCAMAACSILFADFRASPQSNIVRKNRGFDLT